MSCDGHQCIEEGAGGLECELERIELEQEVVPLGVMEQAPLELGGILVHVVVEGVEQEHLVGGDDCSRLTMMARSRPRVVDGYTKSGSCRRRSPAGSSQRRINR